MILNRDTLTAELIRDEGVRLRPYLDSVGKWTIGVGRNLSDVGISQAEALLLLAHDVDAAMTDLAEAFPWFVQLNGVRQRALVNMRFNLGAAGFRKFKGTIAALEQGNYRAAAEGMRLSKWAKQVGQRAERLAVMMEHGEEPVEPQRRFRSPSRRKDTWQV
jgi:lysozyme